MPRKLYQDKGGAGAKIEATDNVCINLTGVPPGNHVGVDPGLRRGGDKPWPFCAPAGPSGFVVDRGLDVGLPFEGRAPDIGAYGFGEERPCTFLL